MKNPKTPVVVVVPEEVWICGVDLFGRPVGDYLLRSLDECEDLEVAGAVGGTPPLGTGLLLIDARAWLSNAALAGICARARECDLCLRVIEARRRSGEAPTIALYVPGGQARARGLDTGRPLAPRELAQILHAASVSTDVVLEGPSLDPSQPACLLDSYEALATVERCMLLERAHRAMKQGVRIRDPLSVHIRGDLHCGSNVEIEIDVILEGDVTLGSGVRIGAHSILRSSRVGENTYIQPFSIVEDSSIGANGFVGPYGRIRPRSVIGDGVQIGNFVEIKNSQVGAGSRINHHSFIGDAVIGEQVTIGAGTITCNHDGVGSQATTIERGVYIGSGCNLVAPLRIGEGATVGAGSTITLDVPPAKLTLARTPQITIEHWRGPKTRREQK